MVSINLTHHPPSYMMCIRGFFIDSSKLQAAALIPAAFFLAMTQLTLGRRFFISVNGN